MSTEDRLSLHERIDEIETKVEQMWRHHQSRGDRMDSSQSHDPFAPEPVDYEQLQEQSAEELAPPNRGEGDGPGDPHPDQFLDTTPPAQDPAVPEAPAVVPTGAQAVTGETVADAPAAGQGAATNLDSGQVAQVGEPLPPVNDTSTPTAPVPDESVGTGQDTPTESTGPEVA